MSRVPHDTINVPNAEIGDDQYPPPPAQKQASRDASNFVDGSGHIFSMYLEMATEEDKKMVENWKADADGILIFTGLFSASVASLISVSIQDIQENPQDTSNFYLANIYQAIADPNSSNISVLPPISPPPFSPPNSAVLVNALWFLSLVISLTCALLATLLQQWARRYLKITQSRYSLHKRARIRAFFSEGVEKCLLPWTVETLPTLLHISLFLFFVGLVVFLCNVNLTIFKLVLSWVGLCTALYGCITCMPIIRHDSPYYTPLSSLVWYIVTRTLFPIYRFLLWFNRSVRFRHGAYYRFRDLEESCRNSLVRGMQKTAEETALSSPSEIDTRAFMWTFDCLDEDHELEHFFSGLPGFRSSKAVDDPLPGLTEREKWKLYWALVGLLRRTFSSDLLPESVKNRRAMVCAKAVDPEHTPGTFGVLDKILSQYQHSGPLATGIAQIVKAWRTDSDEGTALVAEATLSTIIARALPRNDSWFVLASSQLGVSESLLKDYAARGDSLSLVILIHVVRQQFAHFRKPSWPRYASSSVLTVASNFNVNDTSPELQHEFCALWNQIVNEVQDGDNRDMAFFILRRIRIVFLSLHQTTNAAPALFSTSTDDEDRILWEPSSYPVCNVPGHHSDSTPLIHDGSAPATFSCADLHDRDTTALVPSFLARSPASTSASSNAPLRVRECLTNAPPLVENTSVSARTQTTTELGSSSPNPITTDAMYRTLDTSPRMSHPCTSEPTPAVPTKSKTSTSLPDTFTVEPTAVSHMHSSYIEVPSSSSPHASPTPALDNIFPIAPTAGDRSRSWDPGAAAEGEDSANAALIQEKEKDVLHDDTTVPPDVSSRSPPPPPTANVAVAGSALTLDVAHTGEYLSRPRGHYDIV
ncbi:hypothetical protein V8E53_001689 [Lactarius tabidus]